MTFREKIIILRKLKGLTQDEFASAVGVSRQAVYKWESGQSYPEVPKLLEIKALFNVSIDDLLDDTYDVVVPEKKRKKRTGKPIEESLRLEVQRQVEKQDDATVTEVMERVLEQEAQSAAAAPAEPAPAEIAAAVPAKEPAAETAPIAPETTPAATEAAPAVKDAEPAPAEEQKNEKRGLFGRLFGRK